MLPYSAEVLVAAMAEYNRAWFPAAPLALVLLAVAIALAGRPVAGHAPAADRIVGALLAAAWLWVGSTLLLLHMATLDFMAPVYGWAWIAQGGLLALACVFTRNVRFRLGGDARGRAGLVLAVLGLVVYPLCVLVLGEDWRALPLAGTAPGPTAILTAGFLVAARPRPPLWLFVVPLGWAGVAGFTAYALRLPLDYAVPAAVLIALALAVGARTRGAAIRRDAC